MNTPDQRAGVPSPIGNNSMVAASPFTDFTMGAIIYVLMIGVLVAVMLLGGFLMLNLGMLSKREQDHTGGRNPSDVGVLKGSMWPPEPDRSPILPAEEEDSPRVVPSLSERAKIRWKFGRRPAA